MFDSATSWDVIIVGASFAGLAAAVDLAGSGRVLLVDRDPIGAGQTTSSDRNSRRSVGIELALPSEGQGLHFWLHHPAMPDGYAWDFPAGDHRRVGILTYGASGGLRRRLEDFLGHSVEPKSLHGG